MGRKIILLVVVTLLLAVGVFFGLNVLSQRTAKTGAVAPSKNYVDPYPDDLDRDGITNEEETKLGLNPEEFDTDGDGVSDKAEIDVWKTDPKNVDTDGDGVRDGVEVVEGTDPLKK